MAARRSTWLVLLSACLLAAGCGDGLTEYRDDAGAFRIRLPGAPSTKPDPDLPSSVKAVRFTERGGSYAVAWQDIDLKKAERTTEQRLDDACDSAAGRLRGKEVSRRPIQLGELPGRELVLQTRSGKTVIHTRMYLAGERLYSVVVQGEKWWVERDASRMVLDSFRILEK